jgi:transcription elongation factor B subunit 1
MSAALLSKLRVDDSSSEEGDNQFGEEEEFGDELQPFDYVTLVANDGDTFHLSREVASVSGLLGSLFSGEVEFAESESRRIEFPTIRGIVLKKVVDYMHHNVVWRDLVDQAPRFPIEDAVLVEVLVAADYLSL